MAIYSECRLFYFRFEDPFSMGKFLLMMGYVLSSRNELPLYIHSNGVSVSENL